MSHEYFVGNQNGSSTIAWWQIASGITTTTYGDKFKSGYLNAEGVATVNALGVGSTLLFVMPPSGADAASWTGYGQALYYTVSAMSSSGGGGSCSGGDTVKKYTFTSPLSGSYASVFPSTLTLDFNTSTSKVTMSHEYFVGNQNGSSTLAWWQIASGITTTTYGDKFKSGYVNSEGVSQINSLGVGSSWTFVMPPSGADAAYWTGYGQALYYTVSAMSSTTEGGSCGGTTTPAPPPTTVTKTEYPKTCASGLTPKGTPGTKNFYCEKPVKQTEIKNPDFIKDINLGDLISNMGDYGSTGDRGDGQFDLDSGNHNNGWYLNGAGDNYKSDHVQFTNVPDNGYVNAIGNSWSPEYLITQGKNKIEVPVPSDATTVEKQKRDTDLNNFKSTGSLSEVLAYRVTDLDALKAMQETDKGLTDLFTKTGSTYKHGTNIVSHKVDQTGEGNYSDFKLNEGGYYILASKYTDMVGAKKESASPNQSVIDKHTYYSFIPVSVNFMTDLSYLPVYNNLLTQVNDKMLMTGNQKANHKLANLKYGSYNSLKVPSAYNYVKGNTIIGSTSGGIQLLNRELNPVTITGETSIATTAKVTDVVEYGNGFYIASDLGILYLSCNDNSLSKTSITEPVNDLEMNYDSLYYLTDNKLAMLFADGSNLIESTNEYDLSTMFENPATKAGRVELLNGLLTVSSKDDSSLSEVITLTK
ncbi:MAG: hypothetical protein ABS904_00950 [Solibacillus isronensis]